MHSTCEARRRAHLVFAAFLSIFLIFFLFSTAYGQETTYVINGEVLDARTEQGLPGATVQVEGTGLGTVTGSDGQYSLTARLEPGTYTLVYSFVGYQRERREVEMANQTEISVETVRLEEDILRSEEIVVTGVGIPAERRQLGQSISSISAADLEDSPASTIDRALQGRIAGAYVQQNSGNPAGGISVRLRGTSTVLGSAEPLYVIDGVIVNNDSPALYDLGGGAPNRLADLDPNDIERIEVVKGAAAAALYGSRANNGVVQIFTRRGQEGPPRITFTTRAQMEQLRKRMPVNMAQNEEGRFLDNTGQPFEGPDGEPGRRYDWQDDIFQTALGTEQALSISGGTEGTQYSISGSHYANEGIVRGNFYRRFSGRARLDQQVTDWADLSVGTSFARSLGNDIPNGGLQAAYGALTGFIFGPNTFDPNPDEFGNYPHLGILANPLEVTDLFDFEQETRRFVGDIQASIRPIEGASIDYTLGLDTYSSAGTAFIPRGTSAPGYTTGYSRRDERNVLQMNNDLNLRYQAEVRPGLMSTTLLGGTLQYEETERFAAQSQDLTPLVRVVDSGVSGRVFGDTRSQRVVYGAFLQQTLGIADRLFVTGAGRVDASSVFAPGQRWHFYPKLSASYVLSDERFWQENETLQQFMPRLRLRASLGTSGGLTAIGPFTRFRNYSSQPFAGNPAFTSGTGAGNPDIQPERQRELEVGADIGFLGDRLGIEITYYDQVTTDLLLNRQLHPSSGFLSRLENAGQLENKGLELLVRGRVINRPDFNWTTTLTYAANRNRVTGLIEPTNPEGLLVLGGFGFVVAQEGEPLGVFRQTSFLRDDDGNILDRAGNVLVRDSEGFLRVRDPDPQGDPGDIGIPATGEIQIIGDPNPDFTASWTNEFAVGSNISIRLQLDAVVGQDVFNFTRRLGANTVFGTMLDAQREIEGDLPAGYNAAVFGIQENWVEDGSFVKLRELAVAYTLPAPVPNVESVRLTLTGRNLFSIDSYSGWDPEINVAGQSTTVRNFDFVEVPIPRTFSVGATLNF